MQTEKITKSIKDIEKNEKKQRQLIRSYQNHCPHNHYGSTDDVVKLVENKANPAIKTLKCSICKKNDIALDPPKPDDLKKHMAKVETAMTYLKFKLNTEEEAEKELCDKIGDFLSMGDELYKCYENIFRDSSEKKKNKREGRKDGAARFYIN